MATTISDYLGRTVDVVAYDPGDKPEGLRQLQLQMASQEHGGKICSGIQKIGQRFMLRLLTPRGSMQHLPNEGCEFLLDARRGAWRGPSDVFSSFASASADILEAFMSEELDDDPDDEKLEDAELLAVTLDGDRATVSVRLTTLAGDARVFLQPLPVTI